MRTTPNRTGSTTSSPRLYPPPSTIAPVTAPIPVTVPVATPQAPSQAPPATAPEDAPEATPDQAAAADPKPDARAETMRALRVARRRRRHLMLVCAVIIAVCVVLTLLIVGIARDRRPGSQVVLAGATPVTWHGVAGPLATAVPASRTTTNPDAQASEGAQP